MVAIEGRPRPPRATAIAKKAAVEFQTASSPSLQPVVPLLKSSFPTRVAIARFAQKFMCHLGFASRLATDMHHRPGCRYKSGFPNVMPLFLASDCVVDKLHQFAVRGAAIHQSAQIMVRDRKEASTDLAIGGDPDPAAMSAEGMGDRCNDSDFADTILKSVTSGRFTAFA